MIKAGHINNLGQLTHNLEEGTPQGSVLSPLLCNIYLTLLDEYIDELKVKYNMPRNTRKNSTYNKLALKLKNLRKKGYNDVNHPEYNNYIKTLKLLLNTYSVDETLNIKICFIRYADDFIIGINGSKEFAKSLYLDIDKFLDSIDLKLNKDKTLLTDFCAKPIKFLGFLIKNVSLTNRAYTYTYNKTTGKLIKVRARVRLSIFMDKDRVLKRLLEKKFIKWGIKKNTNSIKILKGTSRNNLINLDHADILRYYSSVMRGIFNYYRIVNNMPKLSNIL